MAGTYCAWHMFRDAADANLSATTLSVDGAGAFDHVLRAAILERHLKMPSTRAILLSSVSSTSPSSCSWYDEEGIRHNVTQAEGRSK